MTFKQILQDDLREKKRLTVDDVMSLCGRYKHYFDTARRNLEEDKTPYSKKTIIGHQIKWWDYMAEKDIHIAKNAQNSPVDAFKGQKPLQDSKNTSSTLQEQLFETSHLYKS